MRRTVTGGERYPVKIPTGETKRGRPVRTDGWLMGVAIVPPLDHKPSESFLALAESYAKVGTSDRYPRITHHSTTRGEEKQKEEGQPEGESGATVLLVTFPEPAQHTKASRDLAQELVVAGIETALSHTDHTPSRPDLNAIAGQTASNMIWQDGHPLNQPLQQ